MIELKPIKRMMNEYKILLEGYEMQLEKFDIDDCKRVIGEIKMFWYRNKKYVDYFFLHISETDEVAFLAGAVRLDIANNGHYEYILVGKTRLINDPLLKMASFYKTSDLNVNLEYINTYLKECIRDLLVLLREYSDDFYILPMDYITSSDDNEYHTILIDAAENMMLSMFSTNYNNIQDIYKENNTYEDIEKNLLPNIKEQLIFDGLKDTKMSLRDRCTNYLKENGNIMPIMEKMGEPQLFIMIVTQYCMQILSIIMIMKTYHMIPFIRNDVTFQYFTLLFHSNISSEFTEKDYLNVYVPYITQKAFDFSDMEYDFVKDYMGNGKLINTVLNSLEQSAPPLPGEVVRCVEGYVSSILSK